MGYQCNASLQVCALRIGRLTAAGAPLVGADNMVVSDALIKLDFKAINTTTNKVEVKNGCGKIMVIKEGDDRTEGVTLALDLCVLDAELIELATGAGLVVIGGQTRGFTAPLPDQDVDRVSVEAWSLAWDVDQQAAAGGNALYHHWVWPSVKFALGDSSLADGPYTQPIVGKGRGNAQIGEGPGGDLPAGVLTSYHNVFVDDNDLPTPTCGYLPIAS